MHMIHLRLLVLFGAVICSWTKCRNSHWFLMIISPGTLWRNTIYLRRMDRDSLLLLQGYNVFRIVASAYWTPGQQSPFAARKVANAWCHDSFSVIHSYSVSYAQWILFRRIIETGWSLPLTYIFRSTVPIWKTVSLTEWLLTRHLLLLCRKGEWSECLALM